MWSHCTRERIHASGESHENEAQRERRPLRRRAHLTPCRDLDRVRQKVRAVHEDDVASVHAQWNLDLRRAIEAPRPGFGIERLVVHEMQPCARCTRVLGVDAVAQASQLGLVHRLAVVTSLLLFDAARRRREPQPVVECVVVDVARRHGDRASLASRLDRRQLTRAPHHNAHDRSRKVLLLLL